MKWHITLALPIICFAFTAAANESIDSNACSIKTPNDTAESELPKLAKISMADAQKIAVDSIKGKSKNKKVGDKELEAEHGCLIYSFDIQVNGKSGTEEVAVDAGTGKILSHTHESPKQVKAEQAEDKAAAANKGK